MALCLSAMSIFVFLNVILRYFFQTGIPWSDEMSRYLMVYMIFLGAILALNNNEHMGVDTLVKRFSPALRRLVYVIVNLIIIVMMYFVAEGSWKMTLLSWHTYAPATGLSLAVVYAVGVISSIGMMLVLVAKIVMALKDRDFWNREKTESGESAQ